MHITHSFVHLALTIANFGQHLYTRFMYQIYQDISQGDKSASRIARLRKHLEAQNLDGFIIPHSDEFQGEYIPEYAERLAWISGFTGSAGMAIVLKDKAAIFVDGRYTIQVAEQIDANIFTAHDLFKPGVSDWIKQNLPKGGKLGFDPWLLTSREAEKFQKSAHSAEGETIAVEQNLVDFVWEDAPAKPSKPIFAQSIEYAGQTTVDKVAAIQTKLIEKSADAVVITLTDSVSWLFNIRGNEIAHNPVVLAYAIVPAKGKALLFLDKDKVPNDVMNELEATTKIIAPNKFEAALTDLGKANAHVMLDKATAPEKVRLILLAAHATIIPAQDPCILPKAIKNKTELQGARDAHKRDGVAMARFLCWLDENAADGQLDEITASTKLEEFRTDTGKLKEISFDTISAAGAHGAITHYRVTTSSNAKLNVGDIYLCDSGGQYVDGTTDITRTVIIGNPTDEMRSANTLVLKGMIGLSRARFPKGTNGAQLDILARQHLWNTGLDFDHGTGHGVGSFLCVHEGPARISKAGTVPLQEGMILSNEPGFYKEGEFGIRIENLVAVTPLEGCNGGDRPMHGFETLTLAPIDLRLINTSLLSASEKQWLNDYHTTVFNQISPSLNEQETTWLKLATKNI